MRIQNVSLSTKLEKDPSKDLKMRKLNDTKNLFNRSFDVRPIEKSLRACSHEPGTVNFPRASVTSRSHDDLLSRGNFIAPGQVQGHLIATKLSDFF